MKTSRKILLSLGAVGAAASIAGLGTFATFTDSDSATHTVSSGTVDIALGSAGADNRLNVSASGLVPGDTMQRRVKLTNVNSATAQALADIKLTTTASPTSVLDSDATNGLQMKIEKCTGTTGWVESTSQPYTYVCTDVLPGETGTRTTVLATQAVIGADLPLSNMAALAVNATDDMVVTVSLPSTADNGFQNKTSTITYTFTGTQRAATSK